MCKGPNKLKKFLKAERSRAAELAKEAGVRKQAPYKWADGSRQPNDDNKLVIERFTNGEIPILDWFPIEQNISLVTPASPEMGNN